ncbi:NAD(P)/FAD-dependent oxidoreductase [Oceanobacillus locisalsi]|uniref:NAD(P)/FAD-dependent oxidoreductase n=1 Tax=Oceanobacillus locisalsi TaxID=546107 RepID=A0ABW3NKC8_9BACI
METDILIIGGGPAGMKAALTADKAGARVILVDESYSLGGQLKQQTQRFSRFSENSETVRGTTLSDELIKQLEVSKVKVLKKHIMIGAYQNGNIGVTDGEKTFEIQSRKKIIAPGAAENAKIFAGWTTPGVMTAGAAHILINRERVLPGKNAIMLGSNDYSLEVARQLQACGVNVKAIVEDKKQIGSSNIDLLYDMKNIPFYLNSTIEKAIGKEELEKVSVNTPDGLYEIDADLICIANGFSPIIEPFEIIGCTLVYHRELGGWLPEYNVRFQTSNPSCYIAGNAAGITSIGSILLTGEIAAISALEEIGLLGQKRAMDSRKKLWKKLSNLENDINEKTFQARFEIINHFYQKMDMMLPEEINSIKGGIHNG